MKNKIIAFYLPQYHQIPENDKWWGEGFTEWVNVKKANPLFNGHNQPRIPENENYYDLSNVSVMEWQSRIAQEHGIYGFCFYHYWFYQKPLLEKPLLNFLNNKNITIPFCLCWANESWTNAWADDNNKVIMEQKYGDEIEWERHFSFLLPFFKDDRYIKEGNKPLIVIYRPYLNEIIKPMLDYWKKLAIQSGFDGLKIASQRFEHPDRYKDIFDYMDYHIEYQPDYDRCHIRKPKTGIARIKQKLHNVILKYANVDVSFGSKNALPEIFDYDEMWRKIIDTKPISEKAIAGGFVDWDNTPRHGVRGSCFKGVTPEKFGKYIKLQLDHVSKSYNNDYLFLFAWNEWGEGGYLEPDMTNGMRYLKELKKSNL